MRRNILSNYIQILRKIAITMKLNVLLLFRKLLFFKEWKLHLWSLVIFLLASVHIIMHRYMLSIDFVYIKFHVYLPIQLLTILLIKFHQYFLSSATTFLCCDVRYDFRRKKTCSVLLYLQLFVMSYFYVICVCLRIYTILVHCRSI